MAATLTGSILDITDPTTTGGQNQISGTQTVTVPADATLAVVFVTGYEAVADYFSSGTVTLGGETMTAVGADSDSGPWKSCGFYRVSPLTGSRTLAWTWGSAPDNGVKIVVVYVKDSDTSSPLRDSEGVQHATTPKTSKTLTAQSGDLILAFDGIFVEGSGDTTTWTDATEQLESIYYGGAQGSIAIASPTGNQTVQVDWATETGEGGLVSLVIKPAAAGAEKVGAGVIGP